jgi:ribosome-associated heat shock protein Hsp15
MLYSGPDMTAGGYRSRIWLPIEKRQGAKEVEKYAQNLTPESELKKMNAPVETFFVKRDRGAGRPTKKERREMDVLYDTLWDSSDSLDGD